MIAAERPAISSRAAQKNREKVFATHLHETSHYTHAATITLRSTKDEYAPSHTEIMRCCRLFLGKINRKIFGRDAVRRKALTIGSAAVIGHGAYGTHPHVHWALQAPPDLPAKEFTRLVHRVVAGMPGLGRQCDVQEYYGVRWLEYMLDHEDFLSEMWFPAKF